MRSATPIILWFCLAALLLCACDDDVPDAVIPQFNQPQAVALVCFDEKDGPQPIEKCSNTARTSAETYAFVTQTVLGEVAVVNLNTYRIVDKESRIPYNSFVPVGGLPVDIAVSADGRTAYTVNVETHDISIIDTAAAIAEKGLNAARSLYIGGPGHQILIATDAPLSPDALGEPISDRFAFVTQPTMGRVAVVNLKPFEAPNPDGDLIEVPMGVIAWLRLDAGTLADTPVTDTRPQGIGPRTIVESHNTGTLYIGGMNGGFPKKSDGSYIIELHRNAFIDRAQRAYLAHGEPTALDADEFAIRRIDLNGYTISQFDIEPSLERWLYAIENESGGVIVVDLTSGELLDINRWDPTAQSPYSLKLPGRAKQLKLFRFDEPLATDELPGPITFNGTFAAVATTQAAVYVIDAEDNFAAHLPDFESMPHSLRYGNDWYSKGKDNTWTPLYPQVATKPRLYGDDTTISLSEPLFSDIALAPGAGGDTDAVTDGCDAHPEGFRLRDFEESQGVYFRCDRRLSRTEEWVFTYQGDLGVSGVGTMQRAKGLEDAFSDETKNFCATGVLGPDAKDTIWDIPADILAGFPYAETYRGYPGDIIEVTSTPAPVSAKTDCTAYTSADHKKWYRVAEIIDGQTLRLAPLEGDAYAPLPTFDCFGQAFTYRVRAANSWVARGTSTGTLKRGSLQNGQCVPWIGETADEDIPQRHCRVFEAPPRDDAENNTAADDAHTFENPYFRLRMPEISLKGDSERDDYDNLFIRMMVANAFTPLRATVGTHITDIALAPNNDVLFVDQSANGLVIFDMLGTFSIRDEPIK